MGYEEFEMIREHLGEKMQKVCIITDQFPPYSPDILVIRGGVEIGLKQLSDKYVKEGYSILVISQHYIKKSNILDEPYIKRIRTYVPYSLEKEEFKNGMKFLINEIFNPLTFWRMYKILKKDVPDVILLGGTHQLSMAPLVVAWFLQIPIHIRYDWICPTYPKTDVCSLRERIFECGNCIEKYNNMQLKKLTKIGIGLLTAAIFKIKIRLWKRSKSILPVNKFYSNMYQALGIPKEIIKVIPTSRKIEKVPLTTEKFKQLRKQHKFILLYVGRLSLEKGIILLLDSFEKVREKNNSVQLLIAGDGLLRNDVRKRANKNALVTYLGWQTKEQLSELYQISDAVVIPSIVPEGHPRTAEEAMSFDKTIIGFDIGGLHEIFEKYPKGIRVRKVDSQELRRAIIRTIEHYSI